VNQWVQIIVNISSWDRAIQHWVTAQHQPGLTWIFTIITGLGNSATLITLCSLATILLIIDKRWRLALILDVGLTSAWLAMSLLKVLFGRIRPLGEHLVYAGGFSFPSGHAMLSLVFYGFVAYIISLYLQGALRWGLQIASGLIILLIGLSRIYLNVHYLSDIVAGFAIGGIFLFIMIRTHKCMEKRVFY